MDAPRILIALGELRRTAEGLVRLPVAIIATGYKGKQRYAITRDTMADIVRNFRGEEKGEIVMDFDHAIEFAAGEGQPVPASGWIKQIDDGPDEHGVLWGSAELTPTGVGDGGAEGIQVHISGARFYGAQ